MDGVVPEKEPEKRSGWQRWIPPWVWRAIRYVIRLYEAYATHQCSLMACACAYCALLSLVPLIVVGIAALGFFMGDSQQALDQTLKAVRNYIPIDADFLRDILVRILEDRGIIGLFGLIGLWFAAHQAFLSLVPAMNIVWNVPETRHWFRQRLIAFGATLASLLLFGGSLAASAFFAYLQAVDFPLVPVRAQDWLFRTAFQLLPVVLTTLLFALLYRWLPARVVPWKAALLGAGIAAVLWEATKITFFQVYLAHFHGYDRLYGPLSALVIVTIWMYYSMGLLLLGAEIAADYEAMQRGAGVAEERAHSGADLASAHGVPHLASEKAVIVPNPAEPPPRP